jgi:hypothetical protein
MPVSCQQSHFAGSGQSPATVRIAEGWRADQRRRRLIVGGRTIASAGRAAQLDPTQLVTVTRRQDERNQARVKHYDQPRLSPDGRYWFAAAVRYNAGDLWVLEPASGALPAHLRNNSFPPSWSGGKDLLHDG